VSGKLARTAVGESPTLHLLLYTGNDFAKTDVAQWDA
jgi:hypothetical protein